MRVGGGRTITVSARCRQGDSFTLTYAGAEAPTVAGPYTFVTRAVGSGARVPLSPQPVVTVDPGPTSQLAVTGLDDAVAGTSQNATVTARDAYGNTTPNYRGTVHFAGSGDDPALSSGDSRWDVPADYAFTAGDAGTHTFAATAKTAGAQTLTATDSQTNAITGSQTITISPGPTALLDARFSSTPGSAVPGQTVRVTIVVTAGDGHGNVATGDNEFVNVRVTTEGSNCEGCVDLHGAFLENGKQTFDIDVAVVSSRLQVSAFPNRSGVPSFGSIFVFFGARPNLDTVKLDWDPTTQNPDGTYDGHLEVKDPKEETVVEVDPNSLVVSGEAVANSNGTTTIPVTYITLDGTTVEGDLTVTTATDPRTGEFVDSTYAPGTPLTVVGCDAAKETFAALAEPAPGAPPPPPCSDTTWSPVTVHQDTAFVLDGANQVAVLVGASGPRQHP